VEDEMKSIIQKAIAVILFCLLGASVPVLAQAVDQKHFSLRDVHLQPDERVVGIELSVKAGSFVSIDRLPIGWLVTIDNDPSWHTTVKGNARVGAAALEMQPLQKLDFCVRKYEFGDLHFSISGDLIVTKDFEHERRIPLRSENFQTTSDCR
jgi:hypothetical protein